jgi:hypothetical protein
VVRGQALEKYTAERTNKNACTYGIVNALDLQQLLGKQVGQGTPVPEGVLATIREREQVGAHPDGESTDSVP